MLPGIDLKEFLIKASYIGVFAVIFAESGLLIGFFLPGDSLLFTAGFFAAIILPGSAAPLFSLPFLLFGCFVAAVVGDSTGYLIGRRFGRRLFQKEDSLLFQKKHVQRAQDFYEKHGPKTIVLARFIPIVRTFVPTIAGVAEMKYQTFVMYNIIGGLLWAVGITLGGFFAGKFIGANIRPEDIDKVLLPIIFLIVLISVAPGAWHILKEKENRDAIRSSVSKLLSRNKQITPAAAVEGATDNEA